MEYPAIPVLFWVAMPVFWLKFTKVIEVSHIHAISISTSITSFLYQLHHTLLHQQ